MKSFTLLATMVLAGCATDPKDIEPVSRSYEPLLVEDCATLMDREATTQRDLDKYSALQSNNRVSDVLETVTGMLGKEWIGWRSRKEDARNERTIARLSGELEAVQAARAIRCAQGASAPDAPAKPES
jgi:hypothetical protein